MLTHSDITYCAYLHFEQHPHSITAMAHKSIPYYALVMSHLTELSLPSQIIPIKISHKRKTCNVRTSVEQ